MNEGKEKKWYVLVAEVEGGKQLLPWIGSELLDAQLQAEAFLTAEGAPKEFTLSIGEMILKEWARKEVMKRQLVLPGSEGWKI